MLTLINIGKLSQNPPSRFIKQAFQNDFEAGLDAMFKHLNKKVAHQFPFEVEAHKIFVNLNLIPNGRKTPEFYLGQLADYILQLKIKLYEMKLNVLSRIFIPISLNTDLIAIIKKVYDMHNIIDRIMGDKLLHQQYMFMYDKIQFVSNSSLKEELETFHSKPFIEDLLPMYLFYESMCHSAKVLSKMIAHSRNDGGHFSIEDYYQPTKHAINTENNLVINCFELKDSLKKALTEELNEKIAIMWKEIDLYGRFWLMEGLFPPEDKDKWLDAITALTNINILVQEDIRDMLLLGIEEKLRNEKVTEKDKHQLILSTSSSKDESKEEHGKTPINRRSSKIVRSQKTLGRITSKDKVPTKRKKSKRESLEGDENEFFLTLGKKTETLRPPSVWNFPIERIETNSTQVSILKKEMLKTEIRKANPFASYHDQRVEKFMELFHELFNHAIDFCKKKGNIWEYTYTKVLNVFNINYQYAPTLSVNDDNKTTEKKTIDTK